MVKIRLRIEKNELSGKVLLAINNKKRYGNNIANELKLPQPNVYRELLALTTEDYLIAHNEKNNPWNKKLFSINWEKIGYRFNLFCMDRIRNKNTKYPNKFLKIKKNKYLQKLLNISFEENYLLYKEKKFPLGFIKDVFEDLFSQIIYHIPPHTHSDLIKKSKKDRDTKLFVEFSKFLVDNTSPKQADLIEEFYH